MDKIPRNLRLEWMRAGDLIPHPQNWRRHPSGQKAALQGSLNTVSWAGAALYNEATGKLIDGHLRRQMLSEGEEMPVLVGSWTLEQEKFILATLDPITALAEADEEMFKSLIQGAGDLESEIQALLDAGDDFSVENIDRGPQSQRGEALGSAGIIKIMVSVPNVAIIEKALSLTGERNRGKAFIIVSQKFIDGFGGDVDGENR